MIRQNPILRIFIPFAIGILAAYFLNIPNGYIYLLGLAIIISLGIYNISRKILSSYNYRWINGLLLFGFWFLIGSFLLNTEKSNSTKFKNDTDNKYYYGYISDVPSDSKSFIKLKIKMLSFKNNDSIISSSEQILAFLPKDSLSERLSYGDCISFKSRIQTITNSGNPMEFDYAGYMARNNIYRMAFISENNWKYTSENKGLLILKLAHKVRQKLLETYKEFEITGKEFAVISALTLGYKEELDQPTKSAFVASGAMHIMAVSGLHVGIIQLILNYLLLFLKRFKRGNLLKMVIIILALWIYALITGLSPSVTRATIMFSFIQIGITFKRDISIYNIVATAAMFILFFRPMQLFNVGFQFSFLAVTGIIFLHTRIYELVKFKYWIIDKAWAITVASLAAQLSLAPLSIYYFNIFPNYFLFSNLVVIPATFIIITLAIGLFTFSITPISFLFAFVLKYVAKGLILFVEFVQHIPFSQTTGLFLSTYSVLLWYILIVLALAFFIRKQAKFLLASLGVIIIILSISIVHDFSINKSKLVEIFNVRKNTAIFIRHGNQSYLFCDSMLAEDKVSQSYYFTKFLSSQNCIDTKVINIDSPTVDKSLIYKNGINIGNKKLLILNDNRYKHKFNEKLDVDYILLENNAPHKVNELTKLFHFKKLIIASNNKFYKIKQWEKECIDAGIEFHTISKDGAFAF